MTIEKRAFNSTYEGEHLNRVAFPMGGIGAGMICLEGGGTFSHVSVRNKPNVFHEPLMFSALWVRGPGCVSSPASGISSLCGTRSC